jgi:hypothetical protein
MRILSSRGRTSRTTSAINDELTPGPADDQNELEARFEASEDALNNAARELYRAWAEHTRVLSAYSAQESDTEMDDIAEVFAMETGRFVSPPQSSCGNIPPGYTDRFPHIHQPWLMRRVEEAVELLDS